METKARRVRCPRCLRVLPEPPNVPVYLCGGCGAKLQAKKRNNTAVDTSQRSDNDSSGKQKMDQVFVDKEASCSSHQLSLLNSADEFDQISYHNDLHSSNKDQDAAKRAENGTVNAPPSVVEECSSEKLKIKQLSDNQEPCCSSNQQSLVNSSDETDQNIHNDPRSSTEFSGHEDPESSPEATTHNRIDQEQEQNQKQDQMRYRDAGKQPENVTVVEPKHSLGKQKIEQLSDDNETSRSLTQLLLVNSTNELDRINDGNRHGSSSELSYHHDPDSWPEAAPVQNRVQQHETEFVSCRNDTEIEESSSDFEKDIENTRIISESDGGSKSSFRRVIAEKLLDTRQKKAVYPDEEDLLSEDGSAELHHRPRFSRISSVETIETARFGGTSYYEYEGSVSSFDGYDNQIPRKHYIDSRRDEHVDSGNRYHFNRRKEEHRSTDVRSFYGLNEFYENPRHRSSMIPENPKMERVELLKLIRELQDQLERTNTSNLQQVPPNYYHLLNNPGRYNQRMAFSGEATAVNRRDVGSCHHCCPEDRHFSAQLPHHHECCNGPNYGLNTYYSPRFSGPSSPKHNHSESDFSASDDNWQRNGVRKPFLSPKKKQYVRPIAGGSPWITCYLCSKLLQLPQSFLLFNKRYHSLRCGACLKVLNFTLSNGNHVSRYYPEEMIAAPPSSEVEDFDTLTGPLAGPVSCSDRSFDKSCSTETDRNGSREFIVDKRKATMPRDPSGSIRPPSSKVSDRRTTTSEIEELEAGPNGSPLHWLMGYASPSKVIRGL